jgi:hypothetical protein
LSTTIRSPNFFVRFSVSIKPITESESNYTTAEELFNAFLDK